MEARRTINKLTGRSVGRLAGALELLLALCLIAGGVMPVYATEPLPEMPHQFYGTVSYNGDPVAEGTLVEAFVDDVKKAETIVDGEGRYGYNPIFRVSGTAGATVTFHVDGIEADEDATWESGKVQELNLTIHEGPEPPVQYKLTISSTAGGNVTTPGEGMFTYYAVTLVDLLAEAEAGYQFVEWTAPAGTFGDASAAETTFTMPAQNVTVTAHFGLAYNLTMASDPVGFGEAIDVGAKGAYTAGATVSIKAEPATGYGFANWTAGPTVTFDDATAEETTFTMPAQAVTVTAHFEEVSPSEVPTVSTQAATGISSYSGTLNMLYTVGNFSPVEVRFACKRSTDPTWFYTTWVSRTADGTYTEVLTGLISQTEYEFKAQLKYNGTVIEGDINRFATAQGASTSLDDLMGYFGCFIATAAYGTPTAEQIDVLREFRDVVLLKSTVGSRFVVLYYQLSPPIADFIARSDLLRTLVRELLVDPIVWIVEATGDIWRN
jgi:uncharacterized repeat protein (TIGR02543 family)